MRFILKDGTRQPVTTNEDTIKLDDGVYRVYERRDRNAWWPVRFRWLGHWAGVFSMRWLSHWRSVDERVMARSFHIGPVCIHIGWRRAV